MKKSVLPVAAFMAFSLMIVGTAVAQDGGKDKEKQKANPGGPIEKTIYAAAV